MLFTSSTRGGTPIQNMLQGSSLPAKQSGEPARRWLAGHLLVRHKCVLQSFLITHFSPLDNSSAKKCSRHLTVFLWLCFRPNRAAAVLQCIHLLPESVKPGVHVLHLSVWCIYLSPLVLIHTTICTGTGTGSKAFVLANAHPSLW